MTPADRFHAQKIAKVIHGLNLPIDRKLTKSAKRVLASSLAMLDEASQVDGVDFSRAQLEELMYARNSGVPVEFETLGPYLADYIKSDGRITADNLIAEDAIGLQAARVIHRFFPGARLVSLYDEYNTQKQQSADAKASKLRPYTARQRKNFRESLAEILRSSAAISATAQEGRDFLLIAESVQTEAARLMVAGLEQRGLIKRQGEEITFVNCLAENPLYQNIRLRTAQGRWLCEALDASAFLKPENQVIAHLIVLPSYMKAQQDKVWEILKVLDIPTRNYHNIFFDPTQHPAKVSKVILAALEEAELRQSRTKDGSTDKSLSSLGLDTNLSSDRIGIPALPELMSQTE